MATKPVFSRLNSMVNATSAINGIITQIETAFQNTLSRDGATPNQVQATIDMNENRIINLPDGVLDSEPVTQRQIRELVFAATNGDILPGSITEPAYASGSVSTRALADDSVTSAKILDGTIATADLANDAITTAKIVDAAVTLAKLANIADQTVLGNLSGSAGTPQEVTLVDLATALALGGSGIPVGTITPFAGSRVPTGYLLADGSAVSRATYADLYAWMCPTATVTFDTGSNLVLWTDHEISLWDRVVFDTDDTLPTGITAGVHYYARDIVAGVSFKIAATAGGSAITLSGSPSGTNTCQGVGFGLGDGSTTFTLPDLRGEFLRGLDLGRGSDASRSLGSFQDHQMQDHVHTTGFKNTTFLYGTAYTSIPQTASPGTNTSNPTTGNHGTETRPRNIAVAYGIKH